MHFQKSKCCFLKLKDMKQLISILFFFCCLSTLQAQEMQGWCTKKMRKSTKPKVDSTVLRQRLRTLSVTATTPYIIKLFVVIFSTDDGSGATVNHNEVRRQIGFMKDYFARHDICFILGAIQVVNNSALYSINKDEEEDLLAPYVREGYVTIFIHNSVTDNDLSNIIGTAYDIPNNYLSVEGPVIGDSTRSKLLTHEMGHCLGLLHTFEDSEGEENVRRSGDCKDCDGDGDFLCDTPADREASPSFISSDCRYTGSRTDDCGDRLEMAPDNLMSYHRGSCNTRFTAGQGNRCRNHIITEDILTDALASDNLTQFFSFTYDDGYRIYLARNTVTFSASSYVATGSAKVNASAKAIVVKAGTQFKPTVNSGYAVLRVNPYCQ
jgi:hypothetical protein